MLVHIDGSHLDDSLEVLSSELPRWSQLLAVAAPGCVKLNEPHAVFVVDNFLFEIGGGKLDNGTWVLVKCLS